MLQKAGAPMSLSMPIRRAIRTAIKARVRSIEHGQLMDEATAELIGEKDIWLSAQPFLNDEDAKP